MKKILLIAVGLSLTACVTQKKVDNYLKNNRDYLIEKCAINFPSNPIYIKGDVIKDSVFITIDGKTIPCPEPSEINNFKPQIKCPDSKIVKITERQTDTIIKPNLASEQRLSNLINDKEQEVKQFKKDVEQLNKEKRNLIMILITSLLMLGLVTYFNIKRG